MPPPVYIFTNRNFGIYGYTYMSKTVSYFDNLKMGILSELGVYQAWSNYKVASEKRCHTYTGPCSIIGSMSDSSQMYWFPYSIRPLTLVSPVRDLRRAVLVTCKSMCT